MTSTPSAEAPAPAGVLALASKNFPSWRATTWQTFVQDFEVKTVRQDRAQLRNFIRKF